jgi:hypothetical protein
LLLIGIGAVISIWSATVPRTAVQTNALFVLFPLELLCVAVGGIAALAYLRGRREQASAMLAVGLYLLVLGAAISTLLPMWLPQDNTILGSAVLASLLAAVGASLAAGAAQTLVDPDSRVGTLAVVVGCLTFVLVTAAGVVYPFVEWRVPVLLAVLIVAVALWRVRHRPERFTLTLALALVAAVASVVVLVVRGPGDWASASSSLKLYSFPVMVMAFGFSLAILSGGLRTED